MTLLLVLIILAGLFAFAGIKGAPYVPVLHRDQSGILKLAGLKPGDTLVDLGSGDGQLLRLAAANGIRCIGYEINPVMVVISRLVCWRYRHLVTIHLADLWAVHLPPADAIYVFLMPRFMPQLAQKLTRELPTPTTVVSYAFPIPGMKPVAATSNTYVYTLGG